MNTRAGQLYQQAQLLPPEERAALAWALVDSVNGAPQAVEAEITKLWVAESHRRSEELKSGAATPLSLSEIKAVFPWPHPNPEQIDSESPELTAEWFASARPASEILPGLFGEAAAAMLEPSPSQHVRLDIEIEDKLLRDALRATGAQSHSEVVDMGLRTLVRWKDQQALRAWRGKLRDGQDGPRQADQGVAALALPEIRHLQTQEALADVDAQQGLGHHEVKAWSASLASHDQSRNSEPLLPGQGQAQEP
jgi:Arc/MetJ family transcription regulator